VRLETSTVIALSGFPAAGNSSLTAARAASRPEPADYPSTALAPILGVVDAGGPRSTAADVPGLIPGASQGKGLGLEFLRPVERTHALVHVLDAGSRETDRDAISDYDALIEELGAYAVEPIMTEACDQLTPLDDSPQLVVLK